MRRSFRRPRILECLAGDSDRGKTCQEQQSVVVTEPHPWDPKTVTECISNIISIGSAITLESYIYSLTDPDHNFLLEMLLQTPSNYRDVVNESILCILLCYDDLDSFPAEIRTSIVLWALNKYLRPKKVPFDSPYIPFIASFLAEQIFRDELYEEFVWILRKIEPSPDGKETFLEIPQFSDTMLTELWERQDPLFWDRKAPNKPAPLLFWIMYHLVESQICTRDELIRLADIYGYDSDVLREYYPPLACQRIDEILAPDEPAPQ